MIFMFCKLCVSASKFSIIFLSDSLHPRGLRCPLILHCGHTICENCVRTSLRSTGKVVCGICKCSSTATHQHTDIRLDFPVNIYLLGIFATRHWGPEPEDSVVTFSASSASNRKASALKGMQKNSKIGELSISNPLAYQNWKESLNCRKRYMCVCKVIVFAEKNLHTNRA
jgi:hypothetical protein